MSAVPSICADPAEPQPSTCAGVAQRRPQHRRTRSVRPRCLALVCPDAGNRPGMNLDLVIAALDAQAVARRRSHPSRFNAVDVCTDCQGFGYQWDLLGVL